MAAGGARHDDARGPDRRGTIGKDKKQHEHVELSAFFTIVGAGMLWYSYRPRECISEVS
jgi:hypothetical protein